MYRRCEDTGDTARNHTFCRLLSSSNFFFLIEICLFQLPDNSENLAAPSV